MINYVNVINFLQLKELIDKDALTELDESKSTTFSLKDLQETDEFWIVEIPTTVRGLFEIFSIL